MNFNSSKMLMMSGVLRRCYVEDSRHHSASEMPGFLTSRLGLPPDDVREPSPDLHRLHSRTPGPKTTVSTDVCHYFLKKAWARLFAPLNGCEVMPNQRPEQDHTPRQAEQIRILESLLREERDRTHELTEELMSARSTLEQLGEVQAELCVERETGRQLVQFLEEAERESAELHALKTLATEKQCWQHI
jgi:hypothetical protein